MTSKIVYASNKGAVGDGTRVTRVSNGGAKFEVMVDAATGRFSEVILMADSPVVMPPVEPPPVTPPVVEPEPPTTPPVNTNTTTATSINQALTLLREKKSVTLKGAQKGALNLSGFSGVTFEFNNEIEGRVTFADLSDVDITGYHLVAGGEPMTMNRLRNIRFFDCGKTGQHINLGTNEYRCENGFDFDWNNCTNIGFYNTFMNDIRNGYIGGVFGNFHLHDAHVKGFGDDGYKINWLAKWDDPDDIERHIKRNTFAVPVDAKPDGPSDYHCDFGQFTSIGADPNIPVKGVVLEDNVGFENHDLSNCGSQGFTAFTDGVGAGRMLMNPVFRRNLVMCSDGHGLYMANVNGALAEDNAVAPARRAQPNSPWMNLGGDRRAGIITSLRNRHSVTDANLPSAFPRWNGIEQPKTREDVIRILAQ